MWCALGRQVLIGTFLLHTSTLKTMLLQKFDNTAELLMKLICERGRQQAADVSEAFSKMFGNRRNGSVATGAAGGSHGRCGRWRWVGAVIGVSCARGVEWDVRGVCVPCLSACVP